MPPRLVHGQAAGQHRKVAPNTLEWCTCSECVSFDYVDVVNGAASTLKGKYITTRQRREHIKEERRKEIALQHTASIIPILSSESGDRPQPSDAESSSASVTNFVEDVNVNEVAQSQDKELLQGDGSEDGLESASGRRSPATQARHPIFMDPRRQPHLSPPTTRLVRIQQSTDIISSPSFLQALQKHPLVFIADPSGYQHNTDLSVVDPAVYELHRFHPSNYDFLNLEASLYDSERYLQQQESLLADKPGYLPRVKKALLLLRDKQAEMIQIRKDSWLQQREIFERESPRMIDSGVYMSSKLRYMEPISCLIYLLTATLHLIADLSLNDLGFVLPCLSLLVSISLKDSPNPESVTIPQSIPSDVRTVVSSMGIDPHHHSMVCCPSCFQTYKYDRQNPASYPELCTYRSTPRGKMCGRRLQNLVRGIKVPKREYVYQDLAHWVARMYARPDIEKVLDNVRWEGGEAAKEGNDPLLKDIWDGSVLRDFKGPDGRHFLDKPDAEGRLVFGLNMDGFNPYGNKTAGKKVSICGIYLVCYNLPPELRYKQENVFLLGIVPGPNEPSTHEVNHVLRPLVDDLLFLWHNGIYLSKTPLFPLGRPVRCALVPVVCDLPAARRVAGLGGHGSRTFCSECLLNLSDINELDQTKWSPRTYEKHYEHAVRWRDASSETERTEVFWEYGARWSELLRLPYWDPKFVVIDAMHGFYLRMFHRHIREVWGMSVEVEDGDGIPTLNITAEDIGRAEDVMRHGSVAELQGLKKVQMQYLCRDIGARYGEKKAYLCKSLIEYRITQGWFQTSGEVVVMAHPGPQSRLPKDGSQVAKLAPPTVNIPLGISTVQAQGEQPQRPDNQHHLGPQELFYTASKATLTKLEHNQLVEMCATIFEGSHGDFVTQTKRDLVAKLQVKRIADGVVGPTGRLIKGHLKRPGYSDIGHNAVQPDASVLPNDAKNEQTLKENLLGIYQTGSKSSIKRLKKSALTVICALKFRGVLDAVREYEDMTKIKLVELLEESRLADGIINEDGTLLADSHADSERDSAVLGQATLKAIRDDMATLLIPSWISRSPKHPGEVQWGKFKAAEWKAFCTINLPITLTRLWALKPKDSKHYRMLENFMHLITAVKIASKRHITFDDINKYEAHMKTYMSGFIDLYPHMNVTPYQHLSLHFPAHLRRFGPTHSWRCFAFERYNGLIQKLPTNNRFGEMEKSKFLRFCRVQNVRSLYDQSLLPPELHRIVKLFNARYELKIPGALLSTGVQTRAVIQRKANLEPTYIRCFEDWMARHNPSIKHGFIPPNHRVLSFVERFGQRFLSGGNANSNVIVQTDSGTNLAAQIFALFTYRTIADSNIPIHREADLQDFFDEVQGQPEDDTGGIQDKDIFVILRAYRPLSGQDAHRDVLRHLPSAVGFRVYNDLSEDLIVVPFTNIKSHFVAQVLNVHGMTNETLQVILPD